MVSHRFRFEQIADVYKRFDQKQGGIEKVFLEVTSFLRSRKSKLTFTDAIRGATCSGTSA